MECEADCGGDTTGQPLPQFPELGDLAKGATRAESVNAARYNSPAVPVHCQSIHQRTNCLRLTVYNKLSEHSVTGD